ncbi:MAG: (Fe-S)-binding protein [Candidatus Methylomirabilales bacterium]
MDRPTHTDDRLRKQGFDTLDPPEYDKILDCIHCGFCLPTCPTYLVLGNEMDSPRGRIYLAKAAHNGTLDVTSPSVVHHMFACLLCRACETACPSSVQFGSIMEATRGQIHRYYTWPLGKRLLRRLIFSVFPYPERVRRVIQLGKLYQRLGLHRLVRGSRLLHKVSESLAVMEELLPPPAEMPNLPPLPEVTPARGEKRYRVGVLSGCVQRIMFAHVNAATVRVLAQNGCEVIVPPGQGCCGSLQAHEGEREAAKAFARRTIETFERAQVDSVIVNAAGCGSLMKEYHDLLKDDPRYAKRAEALSAKVRDILQFLSEIEANGRLGRVPLKATYHDACHLVHGQKVRAEPRHVLARVPGLELVPLNESDFCCGSAGVYNILEPATARAFLTRKLDNIEATGAEAVITGNPGCAMQIAMGLRQRGRSIKVFHPVEILDMAYRAAEHG